MICIAGPSAGGKSALALRLAETRGAEIINADAMQVYAELRILSARPSKAEEARVPHHLYGVVPAATRFSAGAWRERARAVITEVTARGKTPLIVGGTGLYVRALLGGLAPIPPVPDAIRRALAARMAREGAPALHAALARVDPDLAARIALHDTQRILRGLEVFEATGRALSGFQAEPDTPPLSAHRILLLPPRARLYARAERRIDAMLAAGVLEEARRIRDLNLNPALPAMKALGLRSFLAHLDGRISLDTATQQAKIATRRYIKRQLIWARTQMTSWTLCHADTLDEAADTLRPLLTGAPSASTRA